MENVNFYYLVHEYEPKIIFIDSVKKEAFSIDELDLTSIEKTDYPSTDDLDDIISISKEEGYDGSWQRIKSIMEHPSIVEKLVSSVNREEYIKSLKKDVLVEDISANEELIERFWKRFSNQSEVIGKKYTKIYNSVVDYLKLLSKNDSEKLLIESKQLSNEAYFNLLLNNAQIDKNEINVKHFSF